MQAAFRGNTLGLPKICPEMSLPLIDQSMLYTYMKNYHTPERTVLAGVGVEHDTLVDLAREYFVQNTPIWNENPNLIIKSREGLDLSLAQYTGGMVQVGVRYGGGWRVRGGVECLILYAMVNFCRTQFLKK